MGRDLIGREKWEIETPALLVDLDKLESNIAKMAAFFEGRPCRLRPHVKTHKTPAVAHMQLAAGACGITCQTLAEAEVMAQAGINDILISNEIVGEGKMRRAAALARHVNLKVAADDESNVLQLSRAASALGSSIGVLVEVNIGMNRCGRPPGKSALELARAVDRARPLVFLGLLAYEGHTVFIPGRQERQAKAREALAQAVETKELIEKHGLECRVVSSGGTGTYDIAGTYPCITEVEAGSYVTMDASYAAVEGIGSEFSQALSVLATVVSRPAHDRAVVDAGMKAISSDKGLPKPELDGVHVERLAEEHGILVTDQKVSLQVHVGDKVNLIPGHGCTTFALYEWLYGMRNDVVEVIWRVMARAASM